MDTTTKQFLFLLALMTAVLLVGGALLGVEHFDPSFVKPSPTKIN